MNILLTANVRWWNAEAAYAWEKGVGLKQRGHDVTILGLPGSPIVERARREGMKVLPTSGLNSLNPFGWVGTIGSLRSYIRERSIEIVDVHRSEGFALLAAAVRGSGAVLLRTRGDMRCPRRDPFNRFIHVYGCDGLAASGKAVAEQMAYAFNLETEDIRVIYYGVDAVHFSPGDGERLRREWHVGPDDFLVGMIGRADRVKGLGTFLQAAAKAGRGRPGARFLMAVKEDHQDLHIYRDMIAKMGMADRVIELGFRQDIERIYRALDGLVVASTGSEANCRVTLEAMSSGLPVIATAVGVIPEVVDDGKTGYLVEPGDVGAMVEALEDFIDNPDWARTMGEAGRRVVEERFNRTVFASRTEEFYLGALKKARGGEG